MYLQSFLKSLPGFLERSIHLPLTLALTPPCQIVRYIYEPSLAAKETGKLNLNSIVEARRKKRVGNEATDMKVSGCDPKSGGQSLLDLISTQ